MKRKFSEVEVFFAFFFTSKKFYSRVQNLKRYKYSQSKERIIEILYSTDDILIINKPYDLHLQDKKGEEEKKYTLEKLLKSQQSKFFLEKEVSEKMKGQTASRKLRFCHQLDYSTSGVLALSLTRKECGKISKCFQERTTKKQYLAIVFGHIKENEVIIESYIDYDPKDKNGFMMCNNSIESKKGRYGKTKLTVIERGYYNEKKVTKVLLEPVSGRRHQLRVHCLQFGHTILGDCTYAKDAETMRMCLHAHKLFLPCIGKEGKWFVAKDPFGEYFSEKKV